MKLAARILGVVMITAVAITPRAGAQDVPGATVRGRIDRAARTEIVNVARSLAWDTSFEASSVQQLTWRQGGRLVVGPVAEIAPVRNVDALAGEELSRGMFLARIRTSGPIPALGVPAGTSYLWADSSAAGLRWVVVPENAREPLRELPLRVERLGRTTPSRAEFFAGLSAGLIQVPCVRYGCCCVDPSGGNPGCHPTARVLGDVLTGRIRLPDVVTPRIRTIPRVP